MRYPQIAARLFNRPLLIDERKLSVILAVLGPRLGFEVERLGPEMYDDDDDSVADEDRRSYAVVNGVARLPILGTLIHRGSWLDAASGLTGYNILAEQFREALADPDVRAIVFDVDSHGGEAVSDAFRLSDEIHAARGRKPISAVVNDTAASAAFLIASASNGTSRPTAAKR